MYFQIVPVLKEPATQLSLVTVSARNVTKATWEITVIKPWLCVIIGFTSVMLMPSVSGRKKTWTSGNIADNKHSSSYHNVAITEFGSNIVLSVLVPVF